MKAMETNDGRYCENCMRPIGEDPVQPQATAEGYGLCCCQECADAVDKVFGYDAAGALIAERSNK